MPSPNIENQPGGMRMPLHICKFGGLWSVSIVHLGWLEPVGNFTQDEFLEWLAENIEDRSVPRKPRPKQPDPLSDLDLEI